MSGLRQRAGFVAARIAESFEVPLEEAADFVKRTLVNWEDFFAGKSLSHVLVYYQPRFKRTEVRALALQDSSCVSSSALMYSWEPGLHVKSLFSILRRKVFWYPFFIDATLSFIMDICVRIWIWGLYQQLFSPTVLLPTG